MKPAYIKIIPLRRVPRRFDVLDYQLSPTQQPVQRGDVLQVPFGKQTIQGLVWQTVAEPEVAQNRLRTIPLQTPSQHFSWAQLQLLEALQQRFVAPLSAFTRNMLPAPAQRNATPQQVHPATEPTVLLVRDAVARRKLMDEVLRRSIKESGLTVVVVPTYSALGEWQMLAGETALSFTAKQSVKEMQKQLLLLPEAKLVLCLGSQLLLPFAHMQRVVLDLADDAAYAMYEQEPRYDIRGLAKIVADTYGASLTLIARWQSPRLLTWFPTQKASATLGTLAPAITVNRQLETLEDRRLPISPTLLADLRAQKVLWLVDTPDDARALWCAACGTPVRCPTCSNTLQVRSEGREVFCSKDRTRMAAPALCAACGSAHLTMQKKGTAAVRQQLRSVIPAEEFTEIASKKPELPSATARHVLSTTIIQRFPELQFDAVVIPFLDYTITRGDDFAASERAMDILALARMHVAPGGKIFVQTFQPDASFFTHVQNPETWAAHLTEERRGLGYPPAGILVTLEQQSPTRATASLPDFPSFVRASNLSAHLTSLRVPKANYAELVPLLQTLSGQGWNIQVNPPRLPRLQA